MLAPLSRPSPLSLTDILHDFVPVPDAPVLMPQSFSNDVGSASSQSLLGWSDAVALFAWHSFPEYPAHSEYSTSHLEKAQRAAQGRSLDLTLYPKEAVGF